MKPFLTSVLLIWFITLGVVSAQSSDDWTSIRTNNLFLISNAGEQELRQAAVWLEVFHEAFGRLLSRSVVDSTVPTTVILFKDDASFVPFKPIHQGRPANVAGNFQPGQDVNYIVLSLDRGERRLFGAAFHEYVHLHVRDNAPNNRARDQLLHSNATRDYLRGRGEFLPRRSTTTHKSSPGRIRSQPASLRLTSA